MDYAKESLRLHAQWRGKIEIKAVPPVKTKEDLSLAYTPRRCRPLPGDSGPSREVLRSDPPPQSVRRHHRRFRRAGSGRYRPRGRYARYGGQVRSVQGIR